MMNDAHHETASSPAPHFQHSWKLCGFSSPHVRQNTMRVSTGVFSKARTIACPRAKSLSRMTHTSGYAWVKGISPTPPCACSLNNLAFMFAWSSRSSMICASIRLAAEHIFFILPNNLLIIFNAEYHVLSVRENKHVVLESPFM